MKDYQIIETNAEHIIRGLQILVAAREINPDNINIIYVDKKLKQFTLDHKGQFEDGWPEGFFDLPIKLTMDLIKTPKY